jgi:hypothetical protein
VLKECLKDEDWCRLSDRMLVLWSEANQRCQGAGGSGQARTP